MRSAGVVAGVALLVAAAGLRSASSQSAPRVEVAKTTICSLPCGNLVMEVPTTTSDLFVLIPPGAHAVLGFRFRPFILRSPSASQSSSAFLFGHRAQTRFLRISRLLGHDSIKTTEKSYARWAKTRQDRLNKLVIGTWK